MAYDRNDRRGGRKGRRKVCSFCVDKVETIDYKDVPRLRKFISDRSKILPRRVTGTCAAHQRELTTAIKPGSSRSFATVYERLIRDQNCLHEAPAFGVAPLFIWRKANTGEKIAPGCQSARGVALFSKRLYCWMGGSVSSSSGSGGFAAGFSSSAGGTPSARAR